MGIEDFKFPIPVDFKKATYINEPVVTQNDNIIFVVEVYDDGIPFDLSSISTFTLVSDRPGLQPVQTVGAKTGTNEITFEFGSNETEKPGKINATIQLYDVDGRISTVPFTYQVRKDPVKDYIPSIEEQTLIELVLGEGPAILNAAEKATLDAQTFIANYGRREEYNNTTLYKKGNEVGYDGSSYVALQDTQGNLPTDTVYWALRARKGLGDVNSVNDVLPDGNGNVTITIPDPDLSGLATKNELQTLDDEVTADLGKKASIFGTLLSPEVTDKKIEVVAGTIRQDPTDLTKWEFINDEGHRPLGVNGNFATAVGSSITIPFKKTYSKVIAFIASPDENLSNRHNIALGSSVSLSSAMIQGSASVHGSGEIYYNGTSWVVASGAGQDILTGFTPTFAGSTLTVPHSYCPGFGLTINATTRNGTVLPYIPVIRQITATQFTVSFLNYEGAFVSVADTKMAITFNKQYHEGILLDGTGGSSALNLKDGNIWFMGIFEV